MRSVQCMAAAVAATLWAASAGATAPIDHVDNFALLDQAGKYHDLYYLSDAKAVVLMTHDDECAAVSDALPALEQAKASYAGRGVEFLMINTQDDRDAVAAKVRSTSIPVLLDDTHLVSESLQLTHAGEVLVIDPKGWKIAYRGPLDKAKAGNALLTGALDSVLAGQPVKKAQVAARGCAVKVAKHTNVGAKVSYSEQIAPMLIDNCVTCHRTGGIGPWQMANYDTIKGFAPMIREVVRTKRMPPWHADPHVGVWDGDRSLTTEEKQTLVHWIEAGAPRGNGPDPLAELHKTWSEWAFGKPDMVIEVPAFDIPASGIVDYKRYVVPNTLGRDVWVRATDIIPGERTVVHHVIVGVYDPKIADERMRMIKASSPSLGAYVPGNGPTLYPQDTGVLVRKDQAFAFQMHYTTSGKPAHDVTRLGLYFRDSAPTYEFKTVALANPNIKIPPNTKEHAETITQQFPRDMIIYRLTPHAHFRGHASQFTAIYPDGREELLLSVPKYDFNWQTTYTFKTPKQVPAGTKIVHTTVYDNSVQNPANPDPNRMVPWGEQSFDEMLYGVVQFRELTPVDAATQVSSNAGK
ncbi:MAG TPA: redoxin domain-containing protein [Steroidobacteraceae bacterium]|nr:redoxin domain-containing protein [Steroidobacteraceae bacterium]